MMRILLTDIDECSQSLDNCHPKSTCTNVDGSFLCICDNDDTENRKVCQGTGFRKFMVSNLKSVLIIYDLSNSHPQLVLKAI